MQRREVIKRTVLASGALLSAPLYSALLSGCSPKPAAEFAYTPAVFSPHQYALLNDISDVLLPASDTPSAAELGVAQVIDGIVEECYAPEAKDAYMREFTLLDNELQGFSSAAREEQEHALRRLESSEGEVKEAWRHVKQQIIAMYLSSEVVAEKHLNYLPVPGAYEPCIELSDTNGKAWAI